MSLTAEGKRAEPMEETLFFTLCVSLLFNIKTNKKIMLHSVLAKLSTIRPFIFKMRSLLHPDSLFPNNSS